MKELDLFLEKEVVLFGIPQSQIHFSDFRINDIAPKWIQKT
jgi:hypothetical protein